MKQLDADGMLTDNDPYTDAERECAADMLEAHAGDVAYAEAEGDALRFDNTWPNEYFDECETRSKYLAECALQVTPMFCNGEIPWHEQLAEAAAWVREGWYTEGPDRGW